MTSADWPGVALVPENWRFPPIPGVYVVEDEAWKVLDLLCARMFV
jgi:hypothetical protein